jgi:hypothetical protein
MPSGVQPAIVTGDVKQDAGQPDVVAEKAEKDAAKEDAAKTRQSNSDGAPEPVADKAASVPAPGEAASSAGEPALGAAAIRDPLPKIMSGDFSGRVRSKLGKPTENKLGEGSECIVYAVMEIETGALFAVKWLNVSDMRGIYIAANAEDSGDQYVARLLNTIVPRR